MSSVLDKRFGELVLCKLLPSRLREGQARLSGPGWAWNSLRITPTPASAAPRPPLPQAVGESSCTRPSDSPANPRYTPPMASIRTTLATTTTPGNRGRVVAG